MSGRPVTKHDGVVAGDLLVLVEDLESDDGLGYIALPGDVGIIVEIVSHPTDDIDDIVTCRILAPGGSACSRVFVNEVVRFFDEDA